MKKAGPVKGLKGVVIKKKNAAMPAKAPESEKSKGEKEDPDAEASKKRKTS